MEVNPSGAVDNDVTIPKSAKINKTHHFREAGPQNHIFKTLVKNNTSERIMSDERVSSDHFH